MPEVNQPNREPDDWFWTPDIIYAMRGWRYNSGYGRLEGAFDLWLPGTNTAAHKSNLSTSLPIPPEHQAPHWGCNCGFNAYKQPCLELLEWPIIGLVALEGKVIEYEKGYRAERATIVELVVWDSYMSGIESAISETYGVVVHRPKNPWVFMQDGLPKRTRLPWRVPEIKERYYPWLP